MSNEIQYELLKDFEDPNGEIAKGTIKTEHQWMSRFAMLNPGECEIKTDWFKRIVWKEHFFGEENKTPWMDFAQWQFQKQWGKNTDKMFKYLSMGYGVLDTTPVYNAMNWVEITPDTKVPQNQSLLVSIGHKYWVAGRFYTDRTHGLVFVSSEDEDKLIKYNSITHYMLIRMPGESIYIDTTILK